MDIERIKGITIGNSSTVDTGTILLKIKPKKFVKVAVDEGNLFFNIAKPENNKPYYRMNERW